MNNSIMYMKGHLSWVVWIKKRIINNLNFNSITTGPTGSGKSWFDLSLAYQIDKDFDPRQITFSLKGIMEILKYDWFNKKKWKVIIFEEVQTSISNRQWQSIINKLFNYLLSTYRHKNIILLMNSPYTDFVDASSRKLIHTVFEIKGHNARTKMTHVRPKILQYNSKMKKFYEHSLYVIRDGKYNKQTDLYISRPPKHLIKAYERMKIEFTDNLNKEIEAELNSIDRNKGFGTKKTKPLTEIQEKVLELKRTGMNQKEIAKKLNKNESTISETIKYIRKKGVEI